MSAAVLSHQSNGHHTKEHLHSAHRHHHHAQPRRPKAAHHDLGVSIGIEHIYEAFPITIRKTEARGRIVVATRDIKAGDYVLRSIHYTTTVSDEYKTTVCSSCSKASKPGTSHPVKCPKCHEVSFCSETCMQNAEHYDDECAALVKLRDVPANVYTPDQRSEIRMVIKMVAKRTIEKRTGLPQHEKTLRNLKPAQNPLDNVWAPYWEDVCRLVPNSSMFSAEVQASVVSMSEFVRSAMPSVGDLSVSDIADTFYREKCNCFGIWDQDDRCLASAVFPSASFFNHSCIPNATRFDDVNGLVAIRALYPILKGEEVTIAYIDIKNRTTKSRVDELKSYYCFECGCARCKDETSESDDFIHQHVCKREGCTGMIVAAEVDKSAVRRCRTCPYTEPLESYEALFGELPAHGVGHQQQDQHQNL